MSTEVVRIYMPLLDEGTPVLRPAVGTVVAGDVVRVEPSADYDPDLETWQFPPGSQVWCERESRDGEMLLVARRQVG